MDIHTFVAQFRFGDKRYIYCPPMVKATLKSLFCHLLNRRKHHRRCKTVLNWERAPQGYLYIQSARQNKVVRLVMSRGLKGSREKFTVRFTSRVL